MASNPTVLGGPLDLFGTPQNNSNVVSPFGLQAPGGTGIATPSPTVTPPAAPEAKIANTQAPISSTESSSTSIFSYVNSTPSGTAAFFNSIEDLINKNVQQNCLDAYFQSTYHWKLFMAPDTDMISQTGATSISGLNAGINSVQQVIIAESGVTGFNIKDVTFSTIVAGNEITRSETANAFTVTITEPNGISFLDGMIESAHVLGIQNYAKAPYYLQLTFLGYDETGAFVASPAQDFSTGGRWTWALTCTNIDVKLNEAGAVYTVNFQPTNSTLLDHYDLTRTPQPFAAVGDTVGALFADYIKNLNAAWNAKYSGNLIVFDGIITNALGKYFAHPANSDKDPATFKMKSDQAEKNPNRSWKFDSPKGLYTVNVSPGYTVSEFIIDAIKHTKEGQDLAKADANPTAPDVSPGQVNSNNIRESITWVVEMILKVNQFDSTSGNYQKHITFVVSPSYSQEAVLTRTQANVAKGSDVQTLMVQNYIDNGLLRKRYDYIFTGLNTEVLEFDLHFNLQFNNIINNYAGALMRIDAFHVNARLNPINSSPNSNLDEVLDKVNLIALTTGTASTAGSPAANTTAVGPRVAFGSNTPQVAASPTNIYIEDLLSQQTADNPHDYAVPVSFWQGNKDVENNAGSSNFVGQMNRDQSVAGAVWAQIYNNSMVGAYQSIKLTIRGDPFWLGQSNLHRQIQLLNGGLNVKANDLPDHTTGSQLIYVYFRYPVQTGDDFKPALKSSQAFNGLYSVSRVNHHFADGVYKQELECLKANLKDPSLWTAGTTTGSVSPSAIAGTGGAASNNQQVGTSGAIPPSGGIRQSTTGIPNTGSFVDKAPTLNQKLMTDFNLTNEQASGITGNLGYESAGLQTNINEASGGGGYGLAQWTGSRKQDLINYSNANGLDSGSMDAQYGFLSQELNTNHANALAAVRNTSTVADSTTAFQNTFELPQNRTASLPARIALGNQASTLTSSATPTTYASNP
jgi:hypothetical protein